MSNTSILTNHTNLISALYSDLEEAEKVVAALHRAGVPGEDISVLAGGATHETRSRPEVQGLYLESEPSSVEEGAETGALVGGAGGLLAGLSVITIPGAGPLLILGSAIASLIAGMSLGALAGGAVGVLIQLGFNKSLADKISESLERGHVLVAAQSGAVSADTLREVMEQYNPRELLEKVAVE